MTARRLALCGVLAALAAVPLGTTEAATGAPRKARHPQQIAPQRDDADTTATIAPPATRPVDDESMPALFYLPNASRAQMHACGLKWQGLKMAGRTGDETWREFATVCLAASAEPTDKPVR